jgi:hypothetical protein
VLAANRINERDDLDLMAAVQRELPGTGLPSFIKLRVVFRKILSGLAYLSIFILFLIRTGA